MVLATKEWMGSSTRTRSAMTEFMCRQNAMWPATRSAREIYCVDLDKSVGEEGLKVALDAFGLIAKEGRKYGLTCVLATQIPRDVRRTC